MRNTVICNSTNKGLCVRDTHENNGITHFCGKTENLKEGEIRWGWLGSMWNPMKM